LIFGAVTLLFLLIPGMRNMRAFSLLALLGTTYTGGREGGRGRAGESGAAAG
jgi:hypothetical protein